MPRIVDFVRLCNDDWMLQDYLDASGPLLGPPDMYGPPSSGWDVFVISSYTRYLRFRHVDYHTFSERMVSTMVYLYGYGFRPETMARTLTLFLYAEGAWLHCYIHMRPTCLMILSGHPDKLGAVSVRKMYCVL